MWEFFSSVTSHSILSCSCRVLQIPGYNCFWVSSVEKILSSRCFSLSSSHLQSKEFSSNNWNMTYLSLSLLALQTKKGHALSYYMHFYTSSSHCDYILWTPHKACVLIVLETWQVFIEKQVIHLAFKWAELGFLSTGFRLGKQVMSRQNSRGKQRDSSSTVLNTNNW